MRTARRAVQSGLIGIPPGDACLSWGLGAVLRPLPVQAGQIQFPGQEVMSR